MTEIIKIHYTATVFMCGLIWITQLVHYPAFNYVDKNLSSKFHFFHSKRISLIVLPVMLTELASCIYILIFESPDFKFNLSCLLLLLIWASTFFLQMNYHKKLSTNFSDIYVKKLVKTNWIRTLFWTLRVLLLF